MNVESFGLGNRLTVLHHACKMQFDGLSNVPIDFLERLPGSDAAGKVRNVGG